MVINVNGLFPGELQPSETVAGCIDIFENAWPNPLETIEMVEAECRNPDSGVSWLRAPTIGKGTKQDDRTNYNIPITAFAEDTNNLVMQNVHNQMYLLLLASTIPYAVKHSIGSMQHEPYNMLRYRGGQEYKAHSDDSGLLNRLMSAICYLNNDYYGGEIEFPNFKIKIKPEPGMLILFPSNYAYTHIAHPVTEGTKYGLVTWIKAAQ